LELVSAIDKEHRFDITYEVIMDSTGPFRYFIYDPSSLGPQWHENRIRELLGSGNIEEVLVEQGEDWMLRVQLKLVRVVFPARNEIVHANPMAIIQEIGSYLPRKNTVAVNIICAINLDRLTCAR
jgi:hypothetical protein